MTIVISEVNAEIRFLLGDLPEETLSDVTMNKIIQRKIDIYGDTDDVLCEVTYYALLDCLRYLIVQNTANLAHSGASGEVTERYEKEAGVEVREKYADNINSSSWDTLLDYYLDHPEYVCDSLGITPPDSPSSRYVIIGGVSNKEADRVLDNPDSRNGLGLGRRSSYNDIFNNR